jgi:hypothetical protein
MKHTPAPWNIFDSRNAYYPGIEGADGKSVIVFGTKDEWHGVRGDNKEQAEANARLIASAPELLEALKALIKDRDDGYPVGADAGEMWNNARQAIAKAEGA